MLRSDSTPITGLRFPLRLTPHRVIGLLVMIALLAAAPSWLRHRELSRAAESQEYLSSVRAAQARYHLGHGRYADDVGSLDIGRPEPTFFAVGEMEPGKTGDLATSWSLTLTRFGEVIFYGTYTVTFDERGFDPGRSSIDHALRAVQDPVARLANLVIR